MTLNFVTPGIADLRALLTMGVSVKKKENPIGYFGTGFKFALATLLRNNCRVGIKYGNGEISEFKSRKELVRGEEFDFIYLDDEPCHITTTLGKNWTLEQAYRELYANTLDENGSIHAGTLETHGDVTNIIVKGLNEIHGKRSEIFLHEQTPIYKDAILEIYSGESSFYYYKGVKVGSLKTPFKYKYNILSGCSLTEDRTVHYDGMYRYNLQHSVISMTDRHIIKNILESDKSYAEWHLDFDYSSWSPEFEEVAKDFVHDISQRYNPSVRHRWNAKHPTCFLQVYKPTKFELVKITRACDFLQKLGHDISQYKIKYAETLGENIMGAAIEGEIYIAALTLKAGLKQIAATLFEEYFHIHYNIQDYTAAMQNKLIEMYLEEAEQRINEPL